MPVGAWLQKEIRVPPFSWRKFGFAVLISLLPNLIFLAVAVFTDTARPLVNWDYLLPALLFTLPWRGMKMVGCLVFWLALLFDVLMLVMQMFPFLDLNGAWYLMPFIFNAPAVYQALAVGLALYLLAMPFVLQKTGRQTDGFHLLLWGVPLVVAGYFTGHLQYHDRSVQANMFGANNFYYAKSQFQLYQASQDTVFLEAARTEPVFMKLLDQKQAVSALAQPRSERVLLIVNESWGQPKNPALQEAVLARLLAESNRVEGIKRGSFQFDRATVEAELRELCGYRGALGYSFRRAPDEKFDQCLPNVLKKQGYQTFALHGASGQLYDRFSWYPRAGFSHVQTGEHLIGKKTCHSFNGVCDSELFDEVASAFRQEGKVFYYWLTLTTHSDYPEADLFNPRLQCEVYGLDKETMLCRNFRLQSQFFDGLAELVQRPEMKGVEVLVVGDHAPPTVQLGETMKYMQQGEVAWIRFKVK